MVIAEYDDQLKSITKNQSQIIKEIGRSIQMAEVENDEDAQLAEVEEEDVELAEVEFEDSELAEVEGQQ